MSEQIAMLLADLALEPDELTVDFVVGLSSATLEKQRTELAQTVRAFEQSFQELNGRRPTRQEMGSIGDELRALVTVANEIKRREKLGNDAVDRAKKGNLDGPGSAILSLAFDGAQNAALTRDVIGEQNIRSGTDGMAVETAARNEGGANSDGRMAPRPRPASGDIACLPAGFPFASVAELVISSFQYLTLTNMLIVEGIDVLTIRGVDLGSVVWLQQWREYMDWTAFFNLDFSLLAKRYPELTVLTVISWDARYLMLTVGLPLVFAFITVLLIKDLPSVIWLLVLTASLLATIAVIAAKAILAASQSASPQYQTFLGQTDTVLYISIAGLFLCIFSYAIKKVLMLIQQNKTLITEIEHIRSANVGGGFAVGAIGGGLFGGPGYGRISAGSSRSSSPSPSPGPSNPGSPRRRTSSFPFAVPAAHKETRREKAHQQRMSVMSDKIEQKHQQRLSVTSEQGGHGMGSSAIKHTTIAAETEYEATLQIAREQAVAEPPPLLVLLRNFSLMMGLMAILLFGMLRILTPVLYLKIAFSAKAALVTTCAAACLFALVGSSLGLSLTRAGRRLIETGTLTFRSYYIGFLLIILQMIYIPVTTALLAVWHCKETSCPVGSWYPVASSTLSAGATLASLAMSSANCEPCAFMGRSAKPAIGDFDYLASITQGTCSMANELCPNVSSLRLVASPDRECEASLWPFTGTASVLMFLCFTLGTPFLYGFLIREHARRYRALPADPAADADDQWAWRTQNSTANKARNLYSDFEFKWRYYKLLVLFQKLALVSVIVYVLDYPILASAAFVLIHGTFLVINSYSRPYLDPRPDWLAIAVSVVSTFNPAMILVSFLGVYVPPWFGLVMLAVNVMIPILFLLIGFGCSRRERKRKVKRAKKRARMTLEEGSEVDSVPWDPDAEYLRLARTRVDRGINEYTMKFLVNFFAAVVVFCFVCAAFILLGWFHESVTAPVTPSTSNATIPLNLEPCVLEEALAKLEFLEYGSWGAFVAHCCCMPRKFIGDRPLTELWACDNGGFKERVRRETASDLLSPVRNFCATEFLMQQANGNVVSAPSLTPKWNVTARRIGVDFNGVPIFDMW